MKKLCTLALLVSAIFVQQVCADVTGRSFYQPLSITSQQELLSAGNYWYANNKNTKQNALQFLMGQVMKESKGKANPKVVMDLLRKKLS